MKAFYIFDLDGTLADIEHRTHIIQSRQQKIAKIFVFLRHFFKPENKLSNNYSEAWKEFNRCCVNDLPNNSVIATLDKLKAAGAKNLGHLTLGAKLKEWQKTNPELFDKRFQTTLYQTILIRS